MMLDGAAAPSRWVNEDVDALPYADVLPEGWRADVDRLMQEEMRRMKKRPKDYLAEMAPAREIDWSGCPLLEKEFARVAEGKRGPGCRPGRRAVRARAAAEEQAQRRERLGGGGEERARAA